MNKENSQAATTPSTALIPFKLRYHLRMETAEVERLLNQLCAREVIIRGCRQYKPTETRKAAEWLTRQHRPGLLICGAVGTGKTTLARAIRELINHLTIARVKYEDKGFAYSGICGSLPFEKEDNGFMEAVSSTELCRMAADNPTEYERLKKSMLLFVDDLGTEPLSVKNYGNEFTPIAELIEWRNDKMLFTVATTNLSPKGKGGSSELLEFYGTRTESRMAELFDIIAIKGGDHRKEAK